MTIGIAVIRLRCMRFAVIAAATTRFHHHDSHVLQELTEAVTRLLPPNALHDDPPRLYRLRILSAG
jgi:hypothetical protein